MKGKKAAGKSECVKVAIRVRPMNKHEKEENSTICVDVDTQNITYIQWKRLNVKFMTKSLFQ